VLYAIFFLDEAWDMVILLEYFKRVCVYSRSARIIDATQRAIWTAGDPSVS